VLLLSPPTAPHKWHPHCLKCHLLLPQLSKLNLLSRKRSSLPASRLAHSPPWTFPSFLRGNGMATLTHTPRATQTHHKLLSFLPLVIPSQRKPNFTPSDSQTPHFSIPVPAPVSQFLIARSPKNRAGNRLPERAVRATKMPVQHKSLCQARILSPKDPHRAQLLNVVSLPRAPPEPSRTIHSS